LQRKTYAFAMPNRNYHFSHELSLQNERKIPLLPFLYGVVAFVYSTATLNG
jgi:hypothetical protein